MFGPASSLAEVGLKLIAWSSDLESDFEPRPNPRQSRADEAKQTASKITRLTAAFTPQVFRNLQRYRRLRFKAKVKTDRRLQGPQAVPSCGEVSPVAENRRVQIDEGET